MPEEPAAVAGASGGPIGESLSCVTCRSRKLRCDKVKPVCTRCAKVNGSCVYPESRRKPAFKRKNVKELEERLAHVEGLLRNAGEGALAAAAAAAAATVADDTSADVDVEGFASDAVDIEAPLSGDALFQGFEYVTSDISPDNHTYDFTPENPTAFAGDTPTQPLGGFGGNAFNNNELIDLGGMFETPPPFDVIEYLNRVFFEQQQQFALIVHPGRYMHAFYSPPHMRPPMCLQYAIWALASNHNPKYHAYHDVFYQRARRYADMDEMKGNGEYFISVAHAQAWCILATDEAKSMMFTRAAMSCARAVRLAAMMGLHHLDSPPDESSPTLAPPRDWAELEERRRVFWGIFCIDSHCSISTGWPHLIDMAEVTTHLPSTEASFRSGEPMETCAIYDVFKGEHSYSSFAGNIVVCYLFNLILKHAHRPKENDNPENYEYGEYWKRHREIDNTLSSAFMFLPESFRLPENYRESTAVNTNLNLHASIICLHHAALERIETHKLPESAKRISQDRLSAAAQEIVNIMKLTSHLSSSPRTPLAALSLFCAASVYMYFCKETKTPTNVDNLDFMLSAMEAIGRTHSLTRSFLRQALLDIERNGVQDIVQLPRVTRLNQRLNNTVAHNVPLLARTRLSRHSEAQPPLPGLPVGRTKPRGVPPSSVPWPESIQVLESPSIGSGSGSGSDSRTHKRLRTETPSSNSSRHLDPTASGGPPLPFAYRPISSDLPPTSNHHVNANSSLPHANSSLHSSGAGRNSDSNNNTSSNTKDRIGVTIASGILGKSGPKPFATAGQGPSQTRISEGGMGSWQLGGLCASAMAEQWTGAPLVEELQQEEEEENDDGDNNNNNNNNTNTNNSNDIPAQFVYPEDMNIDWDSLRADLSIPDTSATAELQGQRQHNNNNIRDAGGGGRGDS